ncbi:MAG TPA: hypothetical protein DDY41_01250, partial [Arthrobacter bacterium]|nr:hypothetical protein [Arthrobacter sp.]
MTSPRATARPPRAASRRRPLVAALSLAVLLLLAAVLTGQGPSVRPAQSSGQGTAEGISKIKHVVIITQENRSFDSYFGTYPGADGIPMQNGVPTVCLPDPAHGGCVQPFYNAADSNAGA